MSKKPFVIGERVSVSGWVKFNENDDYAWLDTNPAKIIKIVDDDVVFLKALDASYTYSVHQNQLRHLKPRRVRREIWTNRYNTERGKSGFVQFYETKKDAEADRKNHDHYHLGYVGPICWREVRKRDEK